MNAAETGESCRLEYSCRELIRRYRSGGGYPDEDPPEILWLPGKGKGKVTMLRYVPVIFPGREKRKGYIYPMFQLVIKKPKSIRSYTLIRKRTKGHQIFAVNPNHGLFNLLGFAAIGMV